jgi:hypothetical protein
MQTALYNPSTPAPESMSLAANLLRLPTELGLPGVEQFFWGAITSARLAPGYVLKGKNTAALYNLALTVAKIANCQQSQAQLQTQSQNFSGRLADLSCGQCVACRWIEQNAHPAVLTVSRLTYQVEDNKDQPDLLSSEALEKLASKGNWPTIIKTGQVGHLIHQLGLSSDAIRVVIFTDAEELPAAFPSNVVAPAEWRSLEANQDRSFHIRPLQRNVFNAASVNRFLKTLEEPPPRTLFFFLAETEEQLLETVVSRCQVVPCLAANASQKTVQSLLPEAYQNFLADFVRKLSQSPEIYSLSAEFEAFFVQEHGLKAVQALEVFQAWLRQQLQTLDLNEALFRAYRSAQQSVDEAMRMINAKTNETQSMLNLFLTLEGSLKPFLAGQTSASF